MFGHHRARPCIVELSPLSLKMKTGDRLLTSRAGGGRHAAGPKGYEPQNANTGENTLFQLGLQQ